MIRLMKLACASLAGAALLIGCNDAPDHPEAEKTSSTPFIAAVDTARILEASAGEEWLSYGGTYDEQRHSKLTQINTDNVADLGVAWTYDLATNRGVESTPIVVDGNQVGEVTSGTHSPTLQKPIAMAYVQPAFAATGTELEVDIRGRCEAVTVVDLPFYSRNS